MKQVIIKFLFCSLLVSVFISCNRDHLYYSTGSSAAIQFNVDWKQTLLEPNGVSIFSYDHKSGDLVTQSGISSDPNKIEVAHAAGKYDFLLFNDTEYELDNVYFADVENIKTFKILTKGTKAPAYSSLSKAPGMVYATETDYIAKESVSNIEITKQDFEYFLTKPDAGDYTIFKNVSATPERITEFIDIELVVKNLTSAAGAPRTHLTNMAAGYLPGIDKKHDQLLTHEFVLNNKVMLSSDAKDGKISKKLVSFGPHRRDKKLLNQHKLIMHFVLINGEDYIIELDVTKLITSSHDGVQHIHKIRTEIELPVVIGDGGDGPFDPDIEDWEDVEIELPV